MNSAFILEPVRRVAIFIGAYGSGKSEISVNYALWLRGLEKQVILCDLDIINPYYRSADARTELEKKQIRLVASRFAGTNVDVPAVPAELSAAVDDQAFHSVLDIGGEDMGARILSALKNKLAAIREEIALYMVVNTNRPYTSAADQIAWTAQELSRAAGMRIDGLVHNSNLMDMHSAQILEESWPVISQAAQELNIPVVFAAGKDDALPREWQGQTSYGLPLLRLGTHIRYADQK